MGIIDKYFNGYIQIEAKEGCFAKLSNYLLSNNIPAETKDNTVWVSSSSFKRIEGIILRKYCKSVSRVKGLQGIKEKIRCKSAVASALVFSLVLSLFLSSTVWDIRIQGNETVTDSRIIENLSKVGLEIGSLWYTLDRSDIENKLLSHYPEISWININRRGMVAYVVVGENENRPDEPKKKNEYYLS